LPREKGSWFLVDGEEASFVADEVFFSERRHEVKLSAKCLLLWVGWLVHVCS
jgi:hypothetical protein